jgi:hypothetical protein
VALPYKIVDDLDWRQLQSFEIRRGDDTWHEWLSSTEGNYEPGAAAGPSCCRADA